MQQTSFLTIYNTPLIKELPTNEQPQSRLLSYGPAALSTSELLACLLQTSNALFQAQELLRRFGFPGGLLKATIPELCQVPGIGPKKAAQLKAALELGRRAMTATESERDQISSPQDAANLLMVEMGHLDQEHLVVITLDTKNRILSKETLYIGNVNTSVIRISEVLRPAIRQNAPAILISHNHPSGDPSPSPEDVRITRQIVEAGRLMGIEVLDHLIIGQQRYVSLKERGLGFE
jgi:DNA repair protein RadC